MPYPKEYSAREKAAMTKKSNPEPFRPTLGTPTRRVQMRRAQITAKEQERLLRLQERARIDAIMSGRRRGRGSRSTPVQPTQPPIGGKAGQAIRKATGLGGLTEALGRK